MRWILVACVLSLATVGVGSPAAAKADPSSCDDAWCTPGVAPGVVLGASCDDTGHFVFGTTSWGRLVFADDAATHRVTYIVTAGTPVQADIYYRDTDPPSWADYSHNPYLFSPRATARIGPETPWVLEVTLADPRQWAMVTAFSRMASGTADLRCELSVDGVVVASGEGPRGALRSLRHW